jgi:hypothetical protein
VNHIISDITKDVLFDLATAGFWEVGVNTSITKPEAV